jgi:hypothetical protein
MAALAALFVREELAAAGVDAHLSLAVVQTAYANGAATAFLRQHDIPVSTAARRPFALLPADVRSRLGVCVVEARAACGVCVGSGGVRAGGAPA